MEIAKAVITAAGRNQRTLPLQTLIDRDGEEKSVLRIVIEEVLRAGVEEICLVISPGDETAYTAVAGDHAGRLHFVPQTEARGYAHAVHCARDFAGDQPFLHLVGDHLYVSRADRGCARQVVEIARSEDCAVSAVQSTRESQLPYYGTIGGHLLSDHPHLYQIERVLEKPTPTEAEQLLLIPGLRAGHYLCLFGIHALTPALFPILERQLETGGDGSSFSHAMTELARQEQYLALETQGWRYDVGVKYGLLTAQLALSLSGVDRELVLAQLVELLALRQLSQDRDGERS
ncbi:MAG: NTP transferase domain-containing protein [Gemmatimonadetes bacterium]|jgi:UTP--glucose-1-phosphate uridylyltransferase|nr:NTP transferase domain-containing protein [Gemmatimonadota bacterium]